MARVTPPDLELWLANIGRNEFPGVDFDNKFPEGEWPELLVVVRDDSGPKTSPVSFQRTVGFTVVGGTRTNDKPVNDLARELIAFYSDPNLAYLEGPIAAINDDDVRGPMKVRETQDRARSYFTVGYSVVGSL